MTKKSDSRRAFFFENAKANGRDITNLEWPPDVVERQFKELIKFMIVDPVSVKRIIETVKTKDYGTPVLQAEIDELKSRIKFN